MKILTLLENTACRAGVCAAHGLSLYIETPRHKILFDMGPDASFLSNAEALGVDLAAVDLAVLSHGHDDHGGGLAAFCRANSRAPIYVHRAAMGEYYALEKNGETTYIGLPRETETLRDRLIFTGDETVIDSELTLFANPPRQFDTQNASASLREKVGTALLPDEFAHEQNLLICADGKTVLAAGCAHRGIVNILREAERRLGRPVDVTFGGFHLFQLAPGAGDGVIDATGAALLQGNTVYYTGHCTGTYAYDRLKPLLGERLRPMTGGAAAVL